MKCPRDGDELRTEDLHGIEVDRCHKCHGLWLDAHELDELEASTGVSEDDRRATIEYGERKSDLDCPQCGNKMMVFQYRAHAVEIDSCTEEHGYWLDAGEDKRVREIIEERARDLGRAASAEAGWRGFLKGLKRH